MPMSLVPVKPRLIITVAVTIAELLIILIVKFRVPIQLMALS